MRSSIRSRSTSQNLSDDNRSLSVGSAWADSLSSLVPGCDAGKHLIDVSGLRLNFEVRHLLRLRLVAPINDSPLVNPLLLICSNFFSGFRAAAVARRCGNSLERTGRASVFDLWMQARRILGIERAQSCRDSRPDPGDPFFHGWP